MTSDASYQDLAAALDRLPNGFPRTASGVELEILRRIFSPEEASLAGRLGGTPESVEAIAARAGLPVAEARERLNALAERGLIWGWPAGDEPRFRLAPFIVGIYEAKAVPMDHAYAHLVEDYMAGGGAAGIMRPEPALHRVIPAQGAVKSEWILPYDDVRAILEAAKTFHVEDCMCREQQEQLGGRRCDFSLHNCLSFSSHERPPRPGDISRGEALATLAQTEEIGLVHTVSNVIQGVGYVCNCCGCCCGLLRGITDWGIEKSVAYANYYAEIESGTCLGCGVCADRCQVRAIKLDNDTAVVDRAKCIGCGLCVTGCPNEAVKLRRKPEAEIVAPPADFARWEYERKRNRGLIER